MSRLRISTEDTSPSAGSLCSANPIDALPSEQREPSPRSLAVECTKLGLDSCHHLQQLLIFNAEDPERTEGELIAHLGNPPAQFM